MWYCSIWVLAAETCDCVCKSSNFVSHWRRLQCCLTLQINVPTDIDGMDLMAEKVDRKQLVDLLKHMLMLDQERRIKPDEALNHPFQTMSHLLDYVHCTTYDNATFEHLVLLRDAMHSADCAVAITIYRSVTCLYCVEKPHYQTLFTFGQPHHSSFSVPNMI